MSTLLELRERVQADLDLQDETFITDSDINTWINDAIKKAEAVIHTLYEDYFITQTTQAITAGTYLYSYPSDVYANKIRKIIYHDSGKTTSHEVKRVPSLVEGSERDIYSTGSNSVLQWSPYNSKSGGRQIRLFPEAGRAGTLIIWYIRNARQLVDETVDEVTTLADAQSCDIDEFERYILQCVKTECYFKEGDPRAMQSKQLEEQLKVDMIETLSNAVPDNNDEIPMDFSFYNDCEGV